MEETEKKLERINKLLDRTLKAFENNRNERKKILIDFVNKYNDTWSSNPRRASK